MAVKNYLAVNYSWVCNVVEMKYKIENKLSFQNMATNVETSEQNDKLTPMNETYTGHWHRLVLNRNILPITVTYTKCDLLKIDWLYI